MKIAIYSRKSKFTGVGDSIENQVQMCKDYVAIRFKNENIEYSIFEDEGFTGSNTDRPQFQQMIHEIKKFNILICYRVDRISRNVADFSSTLELLQANSCEFISIKEQFDTSSPMGKAMIYIASVFAQLERETIAERIKDNMLEMGKRGLWTGGKTPAGYKSEPITWIDEEGNQRKSVKLVKNEKEIKLIKLVYDVYLKEGSLSKAESWFLQHKIKSKYGIFIGKTTLRIILKNPVYVKSNNEVIQWLKNDGWNVYGKADGIHGLLSYNKNESVNINGKNIKRARNKDKWIAAISSVEGIIDADTWLKVQKQFYNNKNTFPNLGKTHNSILTGKLKCNKCKSNMILSHGRISKTTGKKLFYYVCSMKKRSKGVLCNCKNIKSVEIEESVINKIDSIFRDQEEYIKLLKENLIESNKNDNLNTKKTTIEQDIKSNDKQIERLIDKLSLSNDLEDLFLNKIRTLKKENTKLKKELNEIKSKINITKEHTIDINFIEEIIIKCNNFSKLTKDEQSKIINLIVDDIVYDDLNNEVQVNIIGYKNKS